MIKGVVTKYFQLYIVDANHDLPYYFFQLVKKLTHANDQNNYIISICDKFNIRMNLLQMLNKSRVKKKELIILKYLKIMITKLPHVHDEMGKKQQISKKAESSCHYQLFWLYTDRLQPTIRTENKFLGLAHLTFYTGHYN